MVLWAFLIINLGVLGCNGAKILAFLPMGSHSHQNTYRPIFRALAARGHEITYFTSIPDKDPPYKQIVVDDKMNGASDEIDFYALRKAFQVENYFIMSRMFERSIEVILSTADVQNLICSSDVHFDLVFTESLIAQEVYVAFGHRFQAPVIELTALCPTFWQYHITANPYSFAHTVSYLTVSSDKMSFMERLSNTLMGVLVIVATQYYYLPRQETLANKHFRYPGWETRPPLMDLLQNISLVLQNTHVSTHYPHPYNPNVIEIGGVQLQEPKPLPKELQDYLDNAKEGVIYFSLGSIVQGSLMPEKTKQAFLSAFAKLPFKVLWKWETDSMPNKPENVKISKWLPQKDLLAHPNIKVFITHGGLASIAESIYYGIPIVLIPIFSDQWKNSKQVEDKGHGVILDFDNITEHSILWSLNTVLSQPSYKAEAQRQSKILKDNPSHPLDRAIFWIEYVLRHKGALHLRTAAANLRWYQYCLLDVIAVLFLALVSLVLVVFILLRYIYKMLFHKGSKTNVVSKKKVN